MHYDIFFQRQISHDPPREGERNMVAIEIQPQLGRAAVEGIFSLRSAWEAIVTRDDPEGTVLHVFYPADDLIYKRPDAVARAIGSDMDPLRLHDIDLIERIDDGTGIVSQKIGQI